MSHSGWSCLTPKLNDANDHVNRLATGVTSPFQIAANRQGCPRHRIALLKRLPSIPIRQEGLLRTASKGIAAIADRERRTRWRCPGLVVPTVHTMVEVSLEPLVQPIRSNPIQQGSEAIRLRETADRKRRPARHRRDHGLEGLQNRRPPPRAVPAPADLLTSRAVRIRPGRPRSPSQQLTTAVKLFEPQVLNLQRGVVTCHGPSVDSSLR